MKLSQIMVNEVSLVDKAANKRKFLLYKRDTNAESFADVLKSVASDLDDLLALVTPDGKRNEIPDQAKQAKELLGAKLAKAFQLLHTPEEIAALAKAVTPTSKDNTPPPAKDDIELSEEELKVVDALDKAVTSLQQELVGLKG